jgi:hypothetical protein
MEKGGLLEFCTPRVLYVSWTDFIGTITGLFILLPSVRRSWRVAGGGTSLAIPFFQRQWKINQKLFWKFMAPPVVKRALSQR